jgi:hypothetical protein
MKTISPIEVDSLTRMNAESEFYSKPFMLSYSGLNKLLFSPALFYQHYILRQREDTVDKPAIEGKLLHCLLLKPEDFNKEFVLMSSSMPSENPRKVLDKLYECLSSAYPEIESVYDSEFLNKYDIVQATVLELLKEQNLYQSLKTDAQRLDKMLTDANMKYLDYLYQAKRKTVVDQEMYDFATSTVEIIKSQSKIREIMGMDQDSLTTNLKVYNEHEFAHFMEEYSFGLRAIIDNLVVDHDKKVIRINDLKKTSKSISVFKESIDYYNYWLQAALYTMIIDSVKETSFGVNYPVEFRFIVVDPYMQIAPIRINPLTMVDWTETAIDKLNVAEYHLKSRDFSLPYEFLQQDEYEI